MTSMHLVQSLNRKACLYQIKLLKLCPKTPSCQFSQADYFKLFNMVVYEISV